MKQHKYKYNGSIQPVYHISIDIAISMRCRLLLLNKGLAKLMQLPYTTMPFYQVFYTRTAKFSDKQKPTKT